MIYNILEAKTEYKAGNIDKITVLVEMYENPIR